MANEFVIPNWHVALVHFPIAFLIVGTLIELFSFMWAQSSFRTAGRWMILLGALSGIPAALSGIYALADVSLPDVPAVEPWRDAAAQSPAWQNPEQAHMLRDHVKLQSWGVGVAVLVSILWMGSSDLWRARLRLPLLAILLIATALSVIGAWHGGEAVYRHGTGVAPATMPSLADATPTNAPASRKWDEYYIQPLQMHVLMAGFTIALALAALGLSLRAATGDAPRTQVDYIAEALGPVAGDPKPSRPDRPGAEPQDRMPRLPAARFWLLAVLVGLLAALAGDWVLAKSMGSWDPKQLWEQVRQPMENATYPWLTRRLAHVGGGVSIVVLSLIMAIAARLARRSKLVVLFFGLLLLAVIAAQIWFGVLLMFDTVEGPVTKFN